MYNFATLLLRRFPSDLVSFKLLDGLQWNTSVHIATLVNCWVPVVHIYVARFVLVIVCGGSFWLLFHDLLFLIVFVSLRLVHIRILIVMVSTTDTELLC